MAAANIVRVGQILLVTMQDDATDTEAGALLSSVGDQVIASAASGVLIDIATLSVIDSYMVRILASLIGTTRLLGTEAIIAGMRPEVAIAMVELGADLPGVFTAISVDAGIAWLRQRAGLRE